MRSVAVMVMVMGIGMGGERFAGSDDLVSETRVESTASDGPDAFCARQKTQTACRAVIDTCYWDAARHGCFANWE